MTPPLPTRSFRSPWWSTDDHDADFHEAFEAQLRREVGPGHILHGVPARLAARYDPNDDALFELLDGSERYAVVHLTWASRPEPPPWPVTAVYESFEAFAAERMGPDAAGEPTH